MLILQAGRQALLQAELQLQVEILRAVHDLADQLCNILPTIAIVQVVLAGVGHWCWWEHWH